MWLLGDNYSLHSDWGGSALRVKFPFYEEGWSKKSGLYNQGYNVGHWFHTKFLTFFEQL